MSWHRAEQASLLPLPPKMPSHRRVACLCGCGCWFYAARVPGRPPAYVNREHANRARLKRRRSWEQLDEIQNGSKVGA